jgi:NADPH-dependent 2,4-dienoyl-CoA reductase/sulfur reductase-like enzyme
MVKRRRVLVAGLPACALGLARPALAAPARVLVLGGGWAGLAAARALRQQAPELDVLLVDRESALHSLPLSNPWLVGLTPQRLAPLELPALAARLGYRFLQAEVQGVDRTARQVHTAQGRLGYDWLVLAAGAGYDYGAWFGAEAAPAMHARTRFPAGFLASELGALKNGLDAFFANPGNGELVMTIPAPPYRCPPAPYERALLIAWYLKTRGVRAHLTLLDAGAGMPRFRRVFRERYAAQIEHRPHSVLRRIDPAARRVVTDEGELHFAHALLLPPMRASELVARSGLQETDASGSATAWAAVDAVRLGATHDERVFLAGDLLGSVSPLFGAYPKTAHVAAQLGAAVAAQIVARSRGQRATDAALPHSVCHVWTGAEPVEQMQLSASYRRRGDGLIVQTLAQHDNPQPRDEDLAWGRALQSDVLGAAPS